KFFSLCLFSRISVIWQLAKAVAARIIFIPYKMLSLFGKMKRFVGLAPKKSCHRNIPMKSVIMPVGRWLFPGWLTAARIWRLAGGGRKNLPFGFREKLILILENPEEASFQLLNRRGWLQRMTFSGKLQTFWMK